MLSQNQEDYAFYKDKLVLLQDTQETLLASLAKLQQNHIASGYRDMIEHCKARIKCARSVKEKLVRQGLPATLEAALSQIYDVVGIRVVCTFINDIYLIRNWIADLSHINIVNEKDYIRSPKPNGYRSYHIIIECSMHGEIVYAEIQIRTLAMDCWASLEHQLKYKQEIQYQEMIVDELKRCANELASTDLNLQTIRELIESETSNCVEV
ncbi:MAG: GTP pyrophosphokinase [Lachnospiraceae bacterium]